MSLMQEMKWEVFKVAVSNNAIVKPGFKVERRATFGANKKKINYEAHFNY